LISCFQLCLQFSLWPNYEVVDRPARLLALLARLDSLVEGGAEGETPVTVHCSGGVGRSGTFATVYSVHRLLANRDEAGLAELVDGEGAVVLEPLVRRLRQVRHPWCVEGEHQYLLAYNVSLEILKGSL